MAHLRGNYGDLFLQRLAILERVVHMNHERWPSQIPAVFSMESTDQPFRNYTGVSGLGTFSEVAESGLAPEDAVRQLYDKKLTPLKYMKALVHSRETMDDDKFNIFNKKNIQLADSFGQSKDILAADLFNQGDTNSAALYLAADGENIFDTAHLIDSAGTGDNLLTGADLSVTSLQSAFTLLRRTKDDRGLPMMMKGNKLIVPMELEFKAAQLVKSVDDSSTTDRATSSFVDQNYTYMVWDYLTDASAWGVRSNFADKTEGWIWLTRQSMDLNSDVDIRTESLVTVASERFAYGCVDWRGFVKNPGA